MIVLFLQNTMEGVVELKHKLSFEKSFASHEKSKFWSQKNALSAREVARCSNKKFYFDCDVCGHEIYLKCNTVSSGQWCGYCASSILCSKESNCVTCWKKSVASHPKSKYWSKTREQLHPTQVFCGSDFQFYFDCMDCGHEILISAYQVTNGYWCGYCTSKLLCSETSNCVICWKKSFASHSKSMYWSKTKNRIPPAEVFINSNKKFYFSCDCGHELYITCSGVSNGNWCIYCASQRICTSESCISCLGKSFKSHPKSIFWSTDNANTPRSVMKCSNTKYKFVCENGHLFLAALNHVSNGKWCPNCYNKTEGILNTYLLTTFPNVQQQFKVDWCKRQKHLPFDFVIPSLRIIIELDGPQHFRQISNWASAEDNMKTDLFKEKCANDNDYSTIRLLQEDVFNDRNDWRGQLDNAIGHIQECPNVIQNIYIGSNNEYGPLVLMKFN